MPKPKLFIPGPVDISPTTYEAMCSPMIGHRGKDFETLYASMQPGLQEIAGTKRPVFLSTSSAWGVMEGAIRNLVQNKVLTLCCGAFSDKWFDVSQRCGKEAEVVRKDVIIKTSQGKRILTKTPLCIREYVNLTVQFANGKANLLPKWRPR